jgi:hypothetical protein
MLFIALLLHAQFEALTHVVYRSPATHLVSHALYCSSCAWFEALLVSFTPDSSTLCIWLYNKGSPVTSLQQLVLRQPCDKIMTRWLACKVVTI